MAPLAALVLWAGRELLDEFRDLFDVLPDNVQETGVLPERLDPSTWPPRLIVSSDLEDLVTGPIRGYCAPQAHRDTLR
jgi:hypothetical protein